MEVPPVDKLYSQDKLSPDVKVKGEEEPLTVRLVTWAKRPTVKITNEQESNSKIFHI